MSSSSSERRRNLRIKPLPELPAKVSRIVDGKEEPFEVADVGLGGFALRTAGSLMNMQPGDELSLRMSLDRYGEYIVRGSVRHRSADEKGLTGIQILEPESATITALRRYFAELMERGALS